MIQIICRMFYVLSNDSSSSNCFEHAMYLILEYEKIIYTSSCLSQSQQKYYKIQIPKRKIHFISPIHFMVKAFCKTSGFDLY